MKKLIQYFVLVFSVFLSTSFAQSEDPKTYYNIPDDGYAIVPIPFGFPFYGRLFTHSIMFDNGVVSFYDPLTESARLGGQQFNALPLGNNIGSNFHYSIMPLWTDLVGNANSKFYTQTDGSTYLNYSWENVQQWGQPNRINSFGLQIRSNGLFFTTYDKIDISGYPVTIGHVGNASVGEWNQSYYQPPGGSTTLNNIQGVSIDHTSPVVDCSNPLNDPTCLGYDTAYFNQQCSINALYSPSCLGYADAYLQQQCLINALYSPSCLGYDDAYYVQQCTLDPLYDSGCTGYDVAYFDQQCSLNGLYDRLCPNYDIEYAKQNLIKPVETVTVSTTPSIEPTTSPIEVAAVVQLTPQPTSTQELTNVISPSSSSSSTTTSASTSTETKREVSPTRQALAERRLAAAREKAVEDGKKSAEEMSNATSLEQQMEVQNVVLSAMGFVAGFDAYSQIIVPDGVGYRPFTIYDNQRNIDTPAARRLLSGSDGLHKEMVDAQYR